MQLILPCFAGFGAPARKFVSIVVLASLKCAIGLYICNISLYYVLQIRHLVSVETDIAREARLVAEAAAKAPREPLRVQHTLVE